MAREHERSSFPLAAARLEPSLPANLGPPITRLELGDKFPFQTLPFLLLFAISRASQPASLNQVVAPLLTSVSRIHLTTAAAS